MKTSWRNRAVACMAVAIIMAGEAQAWLSTINKTRQRRYGSWGANINAIGQQTILNNGFVAWVDGEEGEYRNVVDFDVRPSVLGFDSADVASATLKWSHGPWGAGRYALTVDQIGSRLTSDDHAADMYGNTIASGIYAHGWVNGGGGSVDVTAAFKAAMDGATSTQGIAFRWYNDNDADPTAPYTGNPADWVVLNTGYSLSDVSIEVEYSFLGSAATIVGFSPVPDANMMRVVLNVPDSASGVYFPLSTTNLVDGAWTNVAHSDDGVNDFVVTNFNYSTPDATGSNRVIYVAADGSQGFFEINVASYGQPLYPAGAVVRLSEEWFGFEAILDNLTSNGTPTTIVVDQPVALTENRTGTGKGVPWFVTLEFAQGNFIDLKNHDLEINGVIDAGLQQIFAGQGLVTGEVQVSAIPPQWFGAVGDGVSDDTDALQKAIDLACRSRVLAVDLNRGGYRVTQTLDCTNTRVPGTIMRDGLRIYGSSFSRTQIIGEGGDNTAVMDVSGSQWLRLDTFRIASGSANRSTVGLFTGCGTLLPQSQNQRYHIQVSMHEDGSANGGKGTIGIWNFGGEQNTYDSIYIHADRPIVLTSHNGSFGYDYDSYVDLLASNSLGTATFRGECFLYAKEYPAVTAIDVNSLYMQNTYVGGVADSAVFEIHGGLWNLHYSGTVEGPGPLLHIPDGTLVAADMGCAFGYVQDTTESMIVLGSTGKIKNSDIKITSFGSGARPLFQVVPGCEMDNTKIKINQNVFSWIEMPEALRTNSQEVGIFYDAGLYTP